jgi:hypothetical protein
MSNGRAEKPAVTWNHRVDRVPFLQSSELGLPHPFTSEYVPLPLVQGGGEGTHVLAGEGAGRGPSSDKGTDTEVL